MATALTEARQRHENPLAPNRVLRQMYRLMLDLRQLEDTMAESSDVTGKRAGAEACLASLAVSLRTGDLLSEAGGEFGLGLLRQAAPMPGKGRSKPGGPLQGVVDLPPMAVATERLLMAVGAAVAAKASGKGQVLLATVGAGELAPALWRQMLGFAARLELPMLFVVLPGGAGSGQGRLSGKSHTWGVPGFPVDGADALALYRVVQESMGRLRGGGGPVLLECVRWRGAGRARVDAAERMRELLLARGILTPAKVDQNKS